jgi:ABC-type multidrug transport system fused ATPase/permease subunit
VQAGKHIAVCGRSGSGKTSLVLSLLRMMDVRNGRVTLDGVEIANASPTPNLSAEEVRSRINVVPQDPFLLPNTTVRFNIDPLSGGSSGEEIVEVLQRVKLWDLVRDQGGLDCDIDVLALSAGQKQLLCFARAMVKRKQCDVLVLDEATSR